ncbi:hypothetical protein CLOP_g23518 [Closterium sp. NIES-67]|nr:hypothetical protein CLOP_g23518 [Closterium sp. NIES-67]
METRGSVEGRGQGASRCSEWACRVRRKGYEQPVGMCDADGRPLPLQDLFAFLPPLPDHPLLPSPPPSTVVRHPQPPCRLTHVLPSSSHLRSLGAHN